MSQINLTWKPWERSACHGDSLEQTVHADLVGAGDNCHWGCGPTHQVRGEKFSSTLWLAAFLDHALWGEKIHKEGLKNFVVERPVLVFLLPLLCTLEYQRSLDCLCEGHGRSTANGRWGYFWRLPDRRCLTVILQILFFQRYNFGGHAALAPWQAVKGTRLYFVAGGGSFGTQKWEQCGLIEYPSQVGPILPLPLHPLVPYIFSKDAYDVDVLIK